MTEPEPKIVRQQIKDRITMLFPLSLPDSAEGWQSVALVATLIAVSLTAIFGVINAAFTWKVNQFKKAESRAKDEQLASDLKAKEVLIATADRKAAEANAVAEIAKEESAKANKRAQELEQENIKLRTDLEKATAEARSKQTELTREQQRMAIEQQKTAAAQKEAAQTLVSAQFSLQQVRSLLMPRRLIICQNREKFIEALKDKPIATVGIVWQSDMFISEPKQFAEDISEALKEAGWAIKSLEGAFVANYPDPLNVKAVSGIKILVRDVDKPTLSEQALLWAFLQSDFVADFFPDKNPIDDEIKLLIWMLPPDGGRVLRPQPSPAKN